MTGMIKIRDKEHQGRMTMTYQIEVLQGKWKLYSPKLSMYVMEGASMDEVTIALANGNGVCRKSL